MKKKILLLFVILAIAISVSGCSKHFNTTPTDPAYVQYNANPVDALNYSLYTNKEITMVLNALESHTANALLVQKGSYPVADEIANLQTSLDMVGEAIESVELLAPPKDYDDERTDILRRMVNAQDTLKAYKTCLEKNELENIPRYIDMMSGDFASLKALFNNLWE